jgi:glyoxalase superfamily protein
VTALIRHITVDCADAYVLAGFWSEVTGYPRHPDDKPEDPAALLIAPDGEGPGLLFVNVPEGKAGKNRLHLDLQPTDRKRDEEVDRLIGLGAKLVADHRKGDGTGWAVLADPEGNEFCVERSLSERA